MTKIISSNVRGIVKVTTDAYIQHCWKNCSLDRVTFLKNEHVHKMVVTVEIEINDTDRECEFFLIRATVLSTLHKLYAKDYNDMLFIYNIESQSMEMIADNLFSNLKVIYSGLRAVECSEDGFFSGRIEKRS